LSKTLTLKEISKFLNGELHSDKNVKVKGINSLESAKQDEITFVISKKYYEGLKLTNACAVIIPYNWPEDIKIDIPFIKVKDPYLAYAKLASFFLEKEINYFGINEKAYIESNCDIASEVAIYPDVYIGKHSKIAERVIIYPGVKIGNNVTINSNTIIYPNVVIYDNCIIGSNVIIHAGAVIGADGFGYAHDESGHIKIPQIGKVIIEDNVEIGANTCIDRAALNETIIKKGTKIDNLVQIGHNCIIGENSILVSHVAIGGSTKVGNWVMIGGQVGIADHKTIGDYVKIAAKSGIAQDIPKGSIVAGSPAIPHKLWLKTSQLIKRLPELFKDVKHIKEILSRLEKEQKEDGNQ